MIFDENASVRYLMKEMDPSDEVIFEKRMLDDDDLLIEVECLRKINRRLDDLPLFTPPDDVRNNVLNQASEHLSQKAGRERMRYWALSAAASIVVVLSAGIFWMVLDENNGFNQQVQQGATANGIWHGFDLNTASSSSSVKPWIDNNEVLYFTGRMGEMHNSPLDSIFRNSYQKLMPVQQSEGESIQSRDLHLTGNSN